MVSNNLEATSHKLHSMMKEVRYINYVENYFDNTHPLSDDILPFSLTIKQPCLTGLNTKVYSKMSYKKQNHCFAIHIECSDKEADNLWWLISKMKNLTWFGKDKPLIQVVWGKFVLVSEVLVSGKTSPGEIKIMNKMASLDTKVVLLAKEDLSLTLHVTLREALLTWFAYPSDNVKEKEHCLFAEVQQGGNPGDCVSVFTPNTPEVENLIV